MKDMKLEIKRKTHEKTDWTQYYNKKKSFFSQFTQKYTMKKILTHYDFATGANKNIRIMELGGGNSCFAEKFCVFRKVNQYDIIDNNYLAIQLFDKKKLNTASYHAIMYDLTCDIKSEVFYDFVYSIGLIEHFSLAKRGQVIKNHFSLCKPNGYVLISFPTPTLKYRFWRKFMEFIHVWHFWDEVPLTIEDVKEDLETYGKIIRTELNKKLFLTQLLVLIKKDNHSNE